jgi:hypothetical protein
MELIKFENLPIDIDVYIEELPNIKYIAWFELLLLISDLEKEISTILAEKNKSKTTKCLQ